MALIIRPKTPTSIQVKTVTEEPICCFDLPDLHFGGPRATKTPYVSVAILDSHITIERHGGNYHIASRFNLETTILDYHIREKDGHECYFHDICLNYLNHGPREHLVMYPESDSATAFTVTRSNNTGVNGNIGLTGSQGPSANVSLGFTRSNGLTVEYALSKEGDFSGNTLYKTRLLGHRSNRKKPDSPSNNELTVRYQWYWAGSQDEIKKLTPDLKHTVKRHVVVKRIIPVQSFPIKRIAAVRAKELAELNENAWKKAQVSFDKTVPAIIAANRARAEAEQVTIEDKKQTRSLEDLLRFEFRIRVRVKRRFGRAHRALLFSSNPVKSRFLKPSFNCDFYLRPTINEANIPIIDTKDIAGTLEDIKKKHIQNWDCLQGTNLLDIKNYTEFLAQEKLWSNRLEVARDLAARTKYDESRNQQDLSRQIEPNRSNWRLEFDREFRQHRIQRY